MSLRRRRVDTRREAEKNRAAEPRPTRSTATDMLAVLVLRGVALGGRFVFIIFATKYMLPGDFGRFGILAALAAFIPGVVGLEAYQVLLRRILQEPARASDTRRFYAIFVLSGSLMSGVLGAVTLAVFGWSTATISLGSAILALEHIGMETARNLINERRPTLSVLSAALRTGAWGVAVPALFFIGVIPAPWTFETVLWYWLVGAIGAAIAGIPIWHLFRPTTKDLHLRNSFRLLKEVAGYSRTWMVYILGLKGIDMGGRFVCAFMISEAAAGRFTFLSMVASLSYVAQKGVVEPIYYPRLIELEATEASYRQFRQINFAVITGASILSILALAATSWLNSSVLPGSELTSFGLLLLGFALLSLSQPAHYRLYRAGMDRVIMLSGVIGCAAMVVASLAATPLWGVSGAAAGMMLGSMLLLGIKSRAARKFAIAASPDIPRPA